MEVEPWPHIQFSGLLNTSELNALEAWPVDGWTWLRHSSIANADARTSLRRYQRLDQSFPAIARRIESLEGNFRDALGIGDGGPELYPLMLLVEDLPGYHIRPHTDIACKVISVQIYLAEDDEHADQGVVLKGNPDKQIPYLKNFGYAFQVTKKSWHYVKRSTTGRRSIQLIFYNTQNPVV